MGLKNWQGDDDEELALMIFKLCLWDQKQGQWLEQKKPLLLCAPKLNMALLLSTPHLSLNFIMTLSMAFRYILKGH